MSKKHRTARPQPGPEPSTPWIYPLTIGLISLGIVLGLAALVAGYLVVTRSPSPSEAAARAAQIPRAGAQELKNVPAGQQVAVQGRISRDNVPLQRNFVLYTHAHETTIGCRDKEHTPCMVDDPTVYPDRMTLELDDGIVTVMGKNYALYGLPATWEPHSWESYKGYEIGNLVTVVGTRDPAADGAVLLASELHSGPYGDLVRDAQMSAGSTLVFGYFMLVVGVLAVLGCAVGLYVAITNHNKAKGTVREQVGQLDKRE